MIYLIHHIMIQIILPIFHRHPSKSICRAAGPPAAPNLPMGWIPRLSSRARRTAWQGVASAKALHHMGFERDYHGIMESTWGTVGLEWNDTEQKMALERDDDWGFKPATIGWALTINDGITHLQTSLGGLWNIKLNHNEVVMLNIEDIHDTAEWNNLISLFFCWPKQKHVCCLTTLWFAAKDGWISMQEAMMTVLTQKDVGNDDRFW